MTTTKTFAARPIHPAVVAQLREHDDAGRTPRLVVDAEGGSPLRCCLRLSEPGEKMLLASYAPLRRWAADAGADPGAYDEMGPVFLHAAPCEGTADDHYPEVGTLPRVFRAYDARGNIVGGTFVPEGGDPERAVGELFDDPAVAFVHARALVHGCFTFAIDRASAAAAATSDAASTAVAG